MELCRVKLSDHWSHNLSIHALGVDLCCDVPWLHRAIDSALGEFALGACSKSFAQTHGVIRLFEHSDVLRHLSTGAQLLFTNWPNLEIYQERERFWIVDE